MLESSAMIVPTLQCLIQNNRHSKLLINLLIYLFEETLNSESPISPSWWSKLIKVIKLKYNIDFLLEVKYDIDIDLIHTLCLTWAVGEATFKLTRSRF